MKNEEYNRLSNILSKNQITYDEKMELLQAYKKHIDKNAIFCLKCPSSVRLMVTRFRVFLITVKNKFNTV